MLMSTNCHKFIKQFKELMKYLIRVIILVTFTSILFNLSAQVETDSTASRFSSKKPYYIVLKDGSSYTGFIIKDDGRELLVRTTNVGEIFIPKVSVESISDANKVGKLKQGKYFGDEVYYIRYLLSPNALSSEKEEVSVTALYGAFMHGTFGVSDNFDVGIGTTWFGNPFTASLKYTVDLSGDLSFAFGGFGITQTYGGAGGYFGGGLGFGVLTKGGPSANITAGAGYGYLYTDGGAIQGPLLTAGANKRFKPRWAIMIDGYFFPETRFYFAGPGFRYFRRKKEGEVWDFGVMMIGNQYFNNGTPVIPIPIISYIQTL